MGLDPHLLIVEITHAQWDQHGSLAPLGEFCQSIAGLEARVFAGFRKTADLQQLAACLRVMREVAFLCASHGSRTLDLAPGSTRRMLDFYSILRSYSPADLWQFLPTKPPSLVSMPQRHPAGLSYHPPGESIRAQAALFSPVTVRHMISAAPAAMSSGNETQLLVDAFVRRSAFFQNASETSLIVECLCL